MAYLRITLLIANLAGCLALGLLSYVAARDGDPSFALAAIALAIDLGLNALYISEAHRPPRNNRLARMWRMWLDAKESELRQRATRRAD